MRPLVVLLILAAVPAPLVGCADDPCLGVTGTCVALTVETMGEGGTEIDGLDIVLTGAATGRRVVPPFSTVSTLPVRVALQLTAVKSGPLHVEVVGVRFGSVIGVGTTDVDIVSGANTAATVVLGGSMARACRDPARSTRCGDLGCWPNDTDCATLTTCGGAPRACSAGKTGHCAADQSFHCCPEDHPVFCQLSVPGCTGCWTPGSTCTGSIVRCPDGKCHSCTSGTYDCATQKCR